MPRFVFNKPALYSLVVTAVIIAVGILAALNSSKPPNEGHDFSVPQPSPGTAVSLPIPDSGAVSQIHGTQRSPLPDSSEPAFVALPEADTSMAERHLLTPFLRDNELWMHDSTSNKDSLIVKDSLGINEIVISPHRRYVAVQWIRQWIGMSGVWADSEEVPQEEINTVSIYDCESGRLIRDLDLGIETFFGTHKWYSNSRIILGAASDFELIGFYLYDAYRDSLQEMPQDFRP